MMHRIKNERECVQCECMFLPDGDEEKCKSCMKTPASSMPEKFVYQDISRRDLEKMFKLILDKVNKLLVLAGSEDEVGEVKGYTKECATCGNVFVADAPAARYCPDCRTAKDGGK